MCVPRVGEEGKLSIDNYNARVYVLSDRGAPVVTNPRGFELEGRGRGSGKTSRRMGHLG